MSRAEPCGSLDNADTNRLDDLIIQIRKTASEALSFDKASRMAGGAAIKAAVAAGNLLTECKQSVGHGSWEDWLGHNLPEISQETACRWVRLAKMSRVTDLSAASSLTDAYRMCGILRASVKEGQSAAAPTCSQAVLRASSTLQKRLRLLLQKDAQISDAERNQLRLLWKELESMFSQVIGKKCK